MNINLFEGRIPKRHFIDAKKILKKELKLKDYPFLDYSEDSLYFYGEPGTGKTFNAILFALQFFRDKRVIQENEFIFMTVPDVLFLLRKSNSNDLHSEIMTITPFLHARLLVLDDIGVEKDTNWSLQTLYMIINHRYNEMKTTIFTSNLSVDDLSEKMGGRIPSRIKGMAKTIKCTKNYR